MEGVRTTGKKEKAGALGWIQTYTAVGMAENEKKTKSNIGILTLPALANRNGIFSA